MPKRWSKRAEDRFLQELATTANVKSAATAAGLSAQAVYRQRMASPGFAERWDAALAQGYARIETMLVRAATTVLDPALATDSDDEPRMTIDQAMTLFKLHRGETRGTAALRQPQLLKLPPIEAVRADILRRIAAIAGETRDGGRAR